MQLDCAEASGSPYLCSGCSREEKFHSIERCQVQYFYSIESRLNLLTALLEQRLRIGSVRAMTATQADRPSLSAVSNLIESRNAQSESHALPLEILHNLRYQHGWRELKLHAITRDSQIQNLSDTSPRFKQSRLHEEDLIYVISGLPMRHSYLHPDFQNHLIRNSIPETSIIVQREWILPMSLGEKWSLAKFCKVFDALPVRDHIKAEQGTELNLEWRDARRVILGMLATNGVGGDGTVAYYIMHEGEVKPRQNG